MIVLLAVGYLWFGWHLSRGYCRACVQAGDLSTEGVIYFRPFVALGWPLIFPLYAVVIAWAIIAAVRFAPEDERS